VKEVFTQDERGLSLSQTALNATAGRKISMFLRREAGF